MDKTPSAKFNSRLAGGNPFLKHWKLWKVVIYAFLVQISLGQICACSILIDFCNSVLSVLNFSQPVSILSLFSSFLLSPLCFHHVSKICSTFFNFFIFYGKGDAPKGPPYPSKSIFSVKTARRWRTLEILVSKPAPRRLSILFPKPPTSGAGFETKISKVRHLRAVFTLKITRSTQTAKIANLDFY